MSKKFKVWLDSGANAFSCRQEIVTLKELNISDDQWNEMTESEQEDVMKDIAFNNSEWGFSEIPE